jgi:hypothetical protein
VSGLYDRAKADEGAVAELRRFRELETEEEAAFSALLASNQAGNEGRSYRLRRACRGVRTSDERDADLARDAGGIAAGGLSATIIDRPLFGKDLA